MVEHLLAVDPTQMVACTHAGNTALLRAAAYGHAPSARVLLRAGADIDIQNESGETALIRACRWGHEDVARLLIQAGADTTLRDNNGRTAQDWASGKGFAEVLSVLSVEKPLQSVLSPTANVAALISRGLLPPGTQAGAGGGAGGRGQGDNASAGSSIDGGDGGDASFDASGADGDGGQPVRVEGWMAKQGHFIRNWKNRWFTLEGRVMTYFSEEGSAKAKGVIHMGPGTDIIVEDRKYTKPYCFTLITPKKRFILQVSVAHCSVHGRARGENAAPANAFADRSSLPPCSSHPPYPQTPTGRQRGRDG